MRSISPGIDISLITDGASRQVSSSFGLSTSPSFHSPSSTGTSLNRVTTQGPAKQLKPFATEDIKILLLENVNQTGRDNLAAQGYQVEFMKTSLSEDELIKKIRWGTLHCLQWGRISGLSIIEMSTSLAYVRKRNSPPVCFAELRI